MATIAVGHIEEFLPKVDNITTYLIRMVLYLTANNIADEKKAAVLLTGIGGKTYGIIRNLDAFDLPSTKSFEDVKRVSRLDLLPNPLSLWNDSTSTEGDKSRASPSLFSLQSCTDWP